MSATPVTHLNFHGGARQALEFYATAMGGRAIVQTYGDFGMPADLPDADKVVFGRVYAANGFTVMAYDVPGEAVASAAGSARRENGLTITDQSFFLALNGSTLEEVTSYWSALLEGAIVVEPLAASAWSAGFGMLTDRFGVTWVLSVVDEAQAQAWSRVGWSRPRPWPPRWSRVGRIPRTTRPGSVSPTRVRGQDGGWGLRTENHAIEHTNA